VRRQLGYRHISHDAWTVLRGTIYVTDMYKTKAKGETSDSEYTTWTTRSLYNENTGFGKPHKKETLTKGASSDSFQEPLY
jgi:hypothetical protein